MSELELSSIANDAVETLEKDNISVKRLMVGSVMVRATKHFPSKQAD